MTGLFRRLARQAVDPAAGRVRPRIRQAFETEAVSLPPAPQADTPPAPQADAPPALVARPETVEPATGGHGPDVCHVFPAAGRPTPPPATARDQTDTAGAPTPTAASARLAPETEAATTGLPPLPRDERAGAPPATAAIEADRVLSCGSLSYTQPIDPFPELSLHSGNANGSRLHVGAPSSSS